MYAPLWVKSNFSFLEGASHPEELVVECARLGLGVMALTDRDGVYGAVKAWRAAREHGVRLIHGSQLSVGGAVELVLLVQDALGWENLCALITRANQVEEADRARFYRARLGDHCAGLIALAGLLPGAGEPEWLFLRALRGGFGDRFYVMVTRHQREWDPELERASERAAARLRAPIVATGEVLYHSPTRVAAQDVLTCIKQKVVISELGGSSRVNPTFCLMSRARAVRRWRDRIEWLARSREVAMRCTFALSELAPRYPGGDVPEGVSSRAWLRQKVEEGVTRRYPEGASAEVTDQLERELELIGDLGYEGYFLTMHEIIEFCRAREILCQGRGSAANSAVCYCLGITAVDPVALGLLFERFLSRERAEPPDIDLDIMHNRREEVLQYVYERFGRARAAMLCNTVRFRARSAIREVGKVLELDERAIDALARSSWRGSAEGGFDTLVESVGLDPRARRVRQFERIVSTIIDFPRHLSIHPGGFLLSEDALSKLVPIQPASMEGRTVIQWDKYDVEELGLFKLDLLGLGGLTLVDDAFRLLREFEGVDVDMATIPANDSPTYDMLCEGDAIGVFQLESRAQRSMLPRLRPRSFYDLVIEISLVRPGPIQGQMVHPYLRRRQGLEEVVYAHPALEAVLGKTLGVPLFQEQVMRVAMVAANYTAGEADQLRRDMAAWRKEGDLVRHRARLISGMKQNGIEESFAERVYQQLKGFASYGFPESHAASFALIAYATAWLKSNHPEIFTCALLRAQPMGFYSPNTIIEDAKRHGVRVLSLDVNASGWEHELVRFGGGLAIRLGLRLVKGAEREQVEALVSRRRERGLYCALGEVVEISGEKTTRALARAGALGSIAQDRRDAMWRARGALARRGDTLKIPRTARVERAPRPRQLGLFEQIAQDLETTRVSTRGHIMQTCRASLSRRGVCSARDVNSARDGRRLRVVGVVLCRQRPPTASGTMFMTLEDETGLVDVIVWPSVFERWAVTLRAASVLGIEGKLQSEDGAVHLIAESVFVPQLEFELPKRSRDFR